MDKNRFSHTNVCFLITNNNKSIVIFDEPGKFLSPNEYMKFWKGLNNYKNQIFIISHSPTFINLVNRNPNLTKFVGDGIYKRIDIEKFTSSFSSIIYKEYYKTREWKIIVQWLFFRKILFLEGIADIAACLTNDKISKFIEMYNINIMETHGYGSVNNINRILILTEIKNFIFFIDHDAVGKGINPSNNIYFSNREEFRRICYW